MTNELVFFLPQYIINQLLEVFLPALPKATSIWKTVERLHKKSKEERDKEAREQAAREARRSLV